MQRHCVRKFTTLIVNALLCVAVVLGGPAWARASAPASATAGTSASSKVMFRVVVLERLDATHGAPGPSSTRRATVQRRVDTVDGQPVLTIVSP